MKKENRINHYIDLHAHLDGCISVDIAKKLAALQQITLPAKTDKELTALLSVPDSCQDLNDFLKCFELPLSLLQTEKALEDAVYLVLSEMHKDGVIYAELRFAPQLHTQKGMTQENAVQSAMRGLIKSPIPGNLILCCMRGESNQQDNLKTLELARKYLVEDGGVVAVDEIIEGPLAIHQGRQQQLCPDIAAADLIKRGARRPCAQQLQQLTTPAGEFAGHRPEGAGDAKIVGRENARGNDRRDRRPEPDKPGLFEGLPCHKNASELRRY